MTSLGSFDLGTVISERKSITNNLIVLPFPKGIESGGGTSSEQTELADIFGVTLVFTITGYFVGDSDTIRSKVNEIALWVDSATGATPLILTSESLTGASGISVLPMSFEVSRENTNPLLVTYSLSVVTGTNIA